MTTSLSRKASTRFSEKLSIAACRKLTRRSSGYGIVVPSEEHRMFHSTEEQQEVEKQWFRRKHVWIIGVIVVLLLAAGLAVFSFARLHRTPDVGGGLTIDADPDTRIYVGDKLVGTTQVSFSWGQLFGDKRHN